MLKTRRHVSYVHEVGATDTCKTGDEVLNVFHVLVSWYIAASCKIVKMALQLQSIELLQLQTENSDARMAP